MEKIFELIKKYQRPLRTVIWTILITIAFLVCLFSSKPCNDGFVVETILFAMFGDMGVYTVSRTIEKIKNKDTNGNS
jgi:hypothetical protein